MAQQVQITNLKREADIDPLSPTLGAIELPHKKIHEGVMYQASTIVSTLADDGNIDMLIRVSSVSDAHSVFNINSGGEAWGYLYENPTVTANGTELTPRNLHRCHTDTSGTKVYIAPTVTNVGTNLAEGVIPGGQKKEAIGGQLRDTTEWILKDGNVYLLRGVNKGGAAKNMSLEVEFYELPD